VESIQLVEHADIVQHPESAAFGRDHQFLLALVELHVGDRRDREIQLERAPVFAVIERKEQTGLRPRHQQALAIRIFAHHAGERIARNPVDDFLPRLAVVRGLVQVRTEIVQLVIGGRHVRRARIVRRGVNRVDADPLRHTRRRNVVPLLAPVARYLHLAIVRPRPDHALAGGRFHDGEDRAVVLHAGVVLRDRSARSAHLGFVVARQVGTDDLPILPLVGGLHEHVGADIKRLRIVR